MGNLTKYREHSWEPNPRLGPLGSFDGYADSIEGAAAHTISLFSLSKSYGFASWRIGYMVIPLSLWDAVNKIQDTILICPPAVSQQAALAAIAALFGGIPAAIFAAWLSATVVLVGFILLVLILLGQFLY